MNALILIVAGVALSQAEPDSPNAKRAEEVKAWRGGLNLIAREHEIAPAAHPGASLKPIENPVFVWSQPIRRGQIGSLYLWVEKDGRPGAVGAFFCFKVWQEYWAIMREFHSLAATPLKGTYRGEVFWEPAEKGLNWNTLPIDNPVASSRTRQLSQVRQISRQFRAYTVSPDKEQWELRVLPRPLYEYAIETGRSVDVGAVVAFCQDMDPELILVIEARPAAGGAAWYYACATFTDYESHLSFGEHNIWNGKASPGRASLSPEKVYWREYISRRASPPKDKGLPATWTDSLKPVSKP